MEQKANIKFCVKSGKSFTETMAMIRRAYGNDALSPISIYEWFARYRDGEESQHDEERGGEESQRDEEHGGEESDIRLAENVEKFRDQLIRKFDLTVTFVAGMAGISRSQMIQSLVKDIDARNLQNVRAREGRVQKVKPQEKGLFKNKK